MTSRIAGALAQYVLLLCALVAVGAVALAAAVRRAWHWLLRRWLRKGLEQLEGKANREGPYL